jgi:site-specific recombinase XerD
VATAQAFLRWQFGRGNADWSGVHRSDIWAFARHCSTRVKPIFAKARLGHLRRSLRFVQLCGACSMELPAAVPKIAVYQHSTPPQILSDRQQRQLRGSFDRTLPEGKRNYAMTLCMLDLGLRGCEVINLRLSDEPACSADLLTTMKSWSDFPVADPASRERWAKFPKFLPAQENFPRRRCRARKFSG